MTPVYVNFAQYPKFTDKILALAKFNLNHVLVYAISPKGKEYFIDPYHYTYELKNYDKKYRKVLSNKQNNIRTIEYLNNGKFRGYLFTLFSIYEILCLICNSINPEYTFLNLYKPQTMIFLDAKLPYAIRILKEKSMLIVEKN